jgi:hypothetical protein
MSLTFVVNGREMDAAQFKAQAQKAKPRVTESTMKRVEDRSVAKMSDGFVVLGYSPEQWAQRVKDHADALKLFADEPLKNKAPGTLEEFTPRWMAKNKPKRARSKPYEIESAADTCAELMRKAGWLHVRVDELMKA